MVIISKTVLKAFAAKHSDIKEALNRWYIRTKQANWRNFSEIKDTFNAVDSVGNDRYVFNIKGNQYRLITLILFKVRTVFILFIGTHSEYDQVTAKQVIFKNVENETRYKV